MLWGEEGRGGLTCPPVEKKVCFPRTGRATGLPASNLVPLRCQAADKMNRFFAGLSSSATTLFTHSVAEGSTADLASNLEKQQKKLCYMTPDICDRTALINLSRTGVCMSDYTCHSSVYSSIVDLMSKTNLQKENTPRHHCKLQKTVSSRRLY